MRHGQPRFFAVIITHDILALYHSDIKEKVDIEDCRAQMSHSNIL
jgi:hypothetical protein